MVVEVGEHDHAHGRNVARTGVSLRGIAIQMDPHSSAEPPSVEIRRATRADAASIAAGMNRAFKRQRDLAWVEWRLFDRPNAEETEIVVAISGDRIIGHVAFEGVEAWRSGVRERLYSAGFLYVDDEFRMGGVASDLFDHGAEHFGDRERISFPFELTRQLVLGRRPDADLPNRMQQWVRWTDAGTLVSADSARVVRIGAPAVVAASRSRPLLERAVRRLPRVRAGLGAPAAHDELASRSATFSERVCIRDHRWLEWRWLQNPDPIRTAHVELGDGRLDGYVAWRKNPLDDRGEIVDLLSGSPKATTALVAHAAEELRRAGAGVVTFDLLDPRPETASALRAAGFLRRGVGSTFFNSHPHEGFSPPDAWLLTLGDSDHV